MLLQRTTVGNNYRNIFLTGTTGVLGAHILKTLLAETDATLHCLVRAGTLESARERLLDFLTIYDPARTLSLDFESRVVPVLGDLTLDRFGLSAEAYDQLTHSVDATIHAGAYTNLFAKFPVIEAINVGGTKAIIQFALATSSKYLGFVSTFTVMGDRAFDADFVFNEDHLDVGQGFSDMSYQHTKFISENLVRDTPGLKWNIFRPGQIFGESTTGYYPQGKTNVSGLFYDIFKTVIESGVAFRSAAHFDVTPVDYVSRAIVHLSVNDSERGRTYHLTNPDAKTYFEVIEILRSLGYDIAYVSQDDYKIMLRTQGVRMGRSGAPYSSITTKAFRWWFRRKHFDYSISALTDASLTRDKLAPAGIVCPLTDRALIGTYIERGIQLNYFPTPVSAEALARRDAPRDAPEVSLAEELV